MTLTLIIFAIVYLGMLLGTFPGLALDRTGMALLGAIILFVFVDFSQKELFEAIDWPVLALLFGLMIVSGQLYFSGFFTKISQGMSQRKFKPEQGLLLFIGLCGFLSAILINDIVCLALTPLVLQVCRSHGWNPLPQIFGLAASSNIGSALTLIGNPQNILISEVMNLSFSKYFLIALPICILGLGWSFLVIKYVFKNKWYLNKKEKDFSKDSIAFDFWQVLKGLAVLSLILVLFFFSNFPKYQIVLAASGILLLSRKMASQKMLGFIDWQFFVLITSLFILKAALMKTHFPDEIVQWMGDKGWNLDQLPVLFFVTFVLSNLFSNVPAVMVLLPFAKGSLAGVVLALSSTLAGNFILTGSLANLIVVQKAREEGVLVSAFDHLKLGIPITFGSILIALFGLYWML